MLWIALQEMRALLRDRGTLVWVFVMPPVFFYFIGSVMGGASSGLGFGQAVPLAVIGTEEAGFLAEPFVEHLERVGYEVTQSARLSALESDPQPPKPARDAQGDAQEGQPRDPPLPSRRLTLPATFTETMLAGEPTALTLEMPRTGPGGDLDKLRVKRAAYTLVADLLAVRMSPLPQTEGETERTPGEEDVSAITAEAIESLAAMPRALTLEVRPAGERQKIPTGFEQSVPGNLVMFVLMVMLTSGAVTLVLERQQGLLRRLASAPLTRVQVVFGKWAGRMMVALLQIASAVIVASLLFPIDWGPDLPMVLLVLIAWGAFATSVGLWLGNLARTEGQVIGLGVLGTMGLAALGGCWWPIEITPKWMQTLAGLLPTGWAMTALHRLMSFQTGPLGAVPYLLLILAATLLVGWMAARRFRFA